MRLFVIALAALLSTANALAQDVPVPAVTTASPGGYANPLQLDTDKGKKATPRSKRADAPFGLCNDQPLTKTKRADLEAGYLSRAKGGERQAYRWLREQCGPNGAWTISRAATRGSVRR